MTALKQLERWVQLHPELAALSRGRFLKRAMLVLGATREDARSYWRSSQFKRVRLLFKRSRTRAQRRGPSRLEHSIVAPPGSYQIDVIFFETDGTDPPTGLRKALTLIEIYSRRAYMTPIQDSDMDRTIIPAYAKLLQQIKDEHAKVEQEREDLGEELAYAREGRIWSAQWAPNHAPLPPAGINIVSGDNEFEAQSFLEYNHARGIAVLNFVSKYLHNPEQQGGNALGVMDAYAKTIKHMVRTYALANDDMHWSNYLQDVIALYNDTPHSGIKMMTPDWVFRHPDSMWDDMVAKAKRNRQVSEVLEAREHHTEEDVQRVMGQRRRIKVKLAGRLEVGDLVLALKDKPSTLSKGPRQNLDKVFVVHTVLPRLRYQLVEYADLLAHGWTTGDLEWQEQLRPLLRVYTRPELYKLGPEDLDELQGDLGLPVEAYRQAQEDVRRQHRAGNDSDYQPPSDDEAVAPRQAPAVTIDMADYPEKYRADLQRYYTRFAAQPGEELLADLRALRQEHAPKVSPYALADLLRRHRKVFLRMMAMTMALAHKRMGSLRALKAWADVLNQTGPYTSSPP